MGNHTTKSVTETKDVEVAESVNHEASYGFHVFEVHMGSVAATSIVMMCIVLWCLCSVAIMAKFRPALGRLWWRVTRGNRKARRSSARQTRRRAENYELRSLTYEQRRSGKRWISPDSPWWVSPDSPDSPCDSCKVTLEKRAVKDSPETVDCGKSDCSV
jgi:hypothetical protein